MRHTKITIFIAVTALSAFLLALSFTPLAGGETRDPGTQNVQTETTSAPAPVVVPRFNSSVANAGEDAAAIQAARVVLQRAFDTGNFELMSSARQNALLIQARVRYDGFVVKEMDVRPAAPRQVQTTSALSSLIEDPDALPNPPVNDPALDTTAQKTQSETTVILTSATSLVSAYNDSGSFTGGNKFTGYSTSTDSGATWLDRGTVPEAVFGNFGDPVLARNKTTGKVFLATLAAVTNGMEIYSSTDNGVTWNGPVNGAPGTASGDGDKEWIAVDNFVGAGNGNVYHAYRDFGGVHPGVLFTRSTDNGATFGPNPGLTIASGTGSNVQGAWTFVGADHAVYVGYYDSVPTPDRIAVRKSTDLGLTFAAAVGVSNLVTTGTNGSLNVPAGYRSSAFPQFVASPITPNLLFSIHPDITVAGGSDSNVFFQQSTDGGATWSANLRLNADAGTNVQNQPSIAIMPDGSALCVTWQDSRADVANRKVQRFGVIGTIVGNVVTFGSNFIVSAPTWTPVFGQDPVVNTVYMGDYDHMDADNSFFYTTFVDCRLGNQDVRFAKIPKAGPVPAPVINVQSFTPTSIAVAPNSCNDLFVTLSNDGDLVATAVSLSLTTSTPGVTILASPQGYGNIAAGGSATNATPFKLSIASSFVCGTSIVINWSSSTGETGSFTVLTQGVGYSFTTSSGNAIIPGTTDIGVHTDDGFAFVALPFTFNYYGVPFTGANVSTNGNLQFTSSSTAFTNVCPLPASVFTNPVMAFWDDLITDPAGNGMFTSISGSAPNRIFNIEWRATYISTTTPLNFEIRLYETTNQIDFVYGVLNGTGTSATVGLQKGTGSGGPSDVSSFSCNTGSLSNGLKISWTFSTSCPQGPGICGAATPTPSPTPTVSPGITPTPPPTPTPTPTPTSTPSPSPSASPCNITTFSNPAAITINDAGVASPYPSNITVSGVTNPVASVTVTLTGFNHTFPADVDVLLVGPGGQKFILVSDVIGGTDAVGINWTFDDTAAAFIGSTGTPASGTFKPTNYTTCQDPFAAPAPAGPYLTPGGIGTPCGTDTLAAFNGVNPNGTWSLYVVDDLGADVGTITGGWSLNIGTSGGCGTPPPSPTVTPPGTPTPTPSATCAPGVWTAATAYPSTICRYAFAQVGEDLYVLGGVSDGTRVNTVNRYNATTNAWTPLATIPVTSEAPAAAVMGGKIYLAEGDTGNSFQIYDIATNAWSTGPARPGVADGYGAAAGAFNGNVFVFGGGAAGPGSNVLSIYNVASNSWSVGPVGPATYFLGGYTQIGQFLYVIGSFTGTAGTNLTVSMRLDMATSTWSTGPVWTPGRADFGLAAVGTKIVAIGGDAQGGGFFDGSTQVDELETSTWPAGAWASSGPNLPSVRQASQAGFFSTGRAGGEIWSTGGLTPAFVFLNEHLFRPSGTCGPSPTPGTPTPSPTTTPGITPTPSATPSCPPSITESSTQTITPLNSVSCNNGTGHTDNSYWRAFTMNSFVGSSSYNVTSVSFGIEQATGAGGTQPLTVRLHTSNQPFPTGWPASLTQIATATVNVPDSASNTIFTVPISATVPSGAILVMEVFTPDGTVAGNLLFMGSNADPESAPSYLSAAGCGITTPTTTAAIGFPNMHLVFNVNGSCTGTTPTPTPSASASPSCAAAWGAGPNFSAVAVLRAPGTYFPANGRFYSIGGRSSDLAGSDFTNPFEYDPGTNTWTTKPSLLPDGKVNNMACGVLTVSGVDQIYCVGGSQATIVGNASRVFSYNPATDTFTTLAAGDDWPGSQAGGFLPGGFAVTGNKLYIIGTFNANSVPPVVTAQVWQFDPTAAVGSKWLARADFPVARGYVPAAAIGGIIYTAGGSNLDPGGLLIDTTESFKYDPVANTWAPITSIPRATAETRAVVMNGKMWVLGGGRVAPNPGNQVDIYDPVANTWSVGLPFDTLGRRNFPADSDGTSRIFLVGGYDNAATQVNTMRIFAAGACASPTPSPSIPPSPTPTPTPSIPPPTPTPTPATPTPTATVTPPGTPTPTPPTTPTPTPGVSPPAQPVNFSTRMHVEGGDRVGIGGFIVTGVAPKRVIIRAIGPSLTRYGLIDVLADPVLELHGPTGFVTIINDNWRDTQEAEIQATGLPPTNNLESAIVAVLAPGNYTALVRGAGPTALARSGLALVEVYDLNQAVGTLGNISTRAFVGTGDNVVIAGFILGNNGGDDNVIARGMGPSLGAQGVPNTLADPTLQLRDANGALLSSNNDWQDNPAQAAIISAAGLAPGNPLESGIAATLPPGLYTALLAGLNNGTGIGLVEVYDRGATP